MPPGLGGGRLVRLSGRSGSSPAGVPARARLAPAVDRGRRLARQGHDRGDDRLRAPRERSRPGVADRCAGPTARRNAGAGGGWLVVEGDESDRTVFSLSAEIAVVTNVELDHHSEFASLAELEAEFDALARGRDACRARRTAVRGPARAARRAQPPERRCGARSARARGRRRAARRLPLLGRFTGTGRRFEVLEARRRHGGRRLRPPSGRDRAHDRGRARAFPGSTLRVLFQPHLVSRTRHLADELAAALAAADDVMVTDVYARAGARSPGSPASSSSTRSPIGACSPPGSPTVDEGAGVPAPARATRATCCSCSAPATSTGPSACWAA